MNERMLTTPEAAQVLGVSAERVRQLIKAGRLPSQQFGRDHVISEADLALVSDRKPGRPKRPAEETPALAAETKTARTKTPVQTAALMPETKTAGKKATPSTAVKSKKAAARKGAAAAAAKPAQKRTAKKGKAA